jgi:hypothetical protein
MGNLFSQIDVYIDKSLIDVLAVSFCISIEINGLSFCIMGSLRIFGTGSLDFLSACG